MVSSHDGVRTTSSKTWSRNAPVTSRSAASIASLASLASLATGMLLGGLVGGARSGSPSPGKMSNAAMTAGIAQIPATIIIAMTHVRVLLVFIHPSDSRPISLGGDGRAVQPARTTGSATHLLGSATYLWPVQGPGPNVESTQ